MVWMETLLQRMACEDGDGLAICCIFMILVVMATTGTYNERVFSALLNDDINDNDNTVEND